MKRWTIEMYKDGELDFTTEGDYLDIQHDIWINFAKKNPEYIWSFIFTRNKYTWK